MALVKLKELAARAGQWLGLSAPAPAATTAVPGDRFDDMTWDETRDQAPVLGELTEELGQRHSYAEDLVRDLFTALYKAAPQVREVHEMQPSRRVNRQIIASVLGTPEFAELHRETAGDQYAAAMGVIAQAGQLRQMTEQARQAQDAADAEAAARQAVVQAAETARQAMALAASAADADGNVPGAEADAARRALDRAEQAEQAAGLAAGNARQARAAAGSGFRAAARQGSGQAARQAREEAALMDAWGVSAGERQRLGFEQRRQLTERLRSGRLSRFASLIGRFRRMAAGERARRIEGAPGVLTGVTLSGNLGALIPSELAALGIPAARAAFAARLAESRLLTYKTTGRDRAGKGAVVAVVDSSGSMNHEHADGITREAWSKALVLSLLDQARAGRRDLVVIYFGSETELQVFRFPAGQPVRVLDVIEMAEFFFDGGTDFEAPLGVAAELLAGDTGPDRQGGDIVFITDGVCGVSGQFKAAWREHKQQAGFRAYGISLAARPSPVMTELCDNVRGIEDLTEPALLADMFRVI